MIPSLVLVDVWQWITFVVLILMAGLLALPEEPYEAARIDGASTLQTLWHLTLPLLSPTISIALLFRFIDSLKAFDIIWAMTGGGPGAVDHTQHLRLQGRLSVPAHGYSGHLAILMLILAISVSTVLLRHSNRRS